MKNMCCVEKTSPLTIEYVCRARGRSTAVFLCDFYARKRNQHSFCNWAVFASETEVNGLPLVWCCYEPAREAADEDRIVLEKMEEI